MLNAFAEIAIFSTKSLVLVILILVLFAGLLSIVAWSKSKAKGGRISIKNLNQKFKQISDELLLEILPKKHYKQILKQESRTEKAKKNQDPTTQKNIYILNFIGDIKASAVTSLREEITAILNIASPKDEVVIRLESAGGLVPAYGLAAAQLSRIRERHIPLTVCVDKVAASGGYMMACVANKILATPFAIIGSIGVIAQLPNFHRFLKDKNIDFEQVTAGNYKRTLSMFGENTKEGREKLREEIEEIHRLFKELIVDYRKNLDIEKVATGEIWSGKLAKNLYLIDELKTSDDYLLEQSKHANLYEITYHMKKTFSEKMASSAQALKSQFFLYG